MSLTNSPSRYGGVTKTFHWLTVLLILCVIPLGLIANDLAHSIRAPGAAPSDADVARAALLFSLHKTVGVTIFFTALARILWAFTQPRPGLLNADRRLEALLAHTVHWLLYGSLLLVPLTGWIHHAATTGFAPIWWPFGQDLPFIRKDDGLALRFAALHVVFERVLVVAILLHVAGALKHHFIDRDATLRRMLPGTTDAPMPPAQSHGVAPFAVALGIWGLALGIGAGLGVFAAPERPGSAPALASVQSDWQVVDGTLALSITQLGNTVEGSFADWTAAIRFDPDIAEGPAGDVTVTVAIASLTLGSVSAQAMGGDYFDVQTFPTATFTAAIERTAQG